MLPVRCGGGAFGRAITYIFGAGRLQLDRAIKQGVQYGEDALALQTALQACQELEVELHGAPLARLDLFFNGGGRLLEQVVYDATARNGLFALPLHHGRVAARRVFAILWRHRLVGQRVDHQDHGRDKGRLERLLYDQLEGEVHECFAQAQVVVVVGQELCDALDLLVYAANGRVGNVEQLLAEAHGDGGLVATARAAVFALGRVVVFIFCAGQKVATLALERAFRGMGHQLTSVPSLSGVAASTTLPAVVIGHLCCAQLAIERVAGIGK